MKVYLIEVEYGRLEPMDDNPHRYDLQPLIEIDDAIVARWREAIDDYDKAQAEMEDTMDRVYREWEGQS